MEHTLQNLKAIVAAHLGGDAADIELLHTFAALGFDSLDQTNLIMEVEDQFEITLPEADAAGCLTVAGLYDCILRAQNIQLD